MKYKCIIGSGDFLEIVFHAWKQACPDISLQRLEIRQGEDYEFDLSLFDDVCADQDGLFIALDERFGNFKRAELMQAALARGFRLGSFVSPSASVAGNVIMGQNVFIGDHASIGPGCQIGFNSMVHTGARLGPGCIIKPSCWIESGVQVGAHVEIGAHCILRAGTLVEERIKIGRGCELGWPRLYRENIPSNTIFDLRYDEPIFVFPGS
ncbi:UDP-3-O-(3-hydroxymyristoyl)glucosamine N-acyltransferase [Delftia lacustris]|uniref:UDP-3-O-(3-hydroxymyristoyl)glucosamine N-acyltransferase n=1 Tax=Delftia lacustris TaxID=558537 RepID=UPI000943579C|nr:UDP-3-O-(3-hydroxymyristoyl)glucosamine N-acyltransferase [Delftia lacustris]